MQPLTTHALVERSNLSRQAVHRLVRLGLLRPQEHGGTFIWAARDVEIARIVRRAREAGVNLFLLGPLCERLNMLPTAEAVREHAGQIRIVRWVDGTKYPAWEIVDEALGAALDIEGMHAAGAIVRIVELVDEGERDE